MNSTSLTKTRGILLIVEYLHLVLWQMRSRSSSAGRQWTERWAALYCHRSNPRREMQGTEGNGGYKPIPCSHKCALATKILIRHSSTPQRAQHWTLLSLHSHHHMMKITNFLWNPFSNHTYSTLWKFINSCLWLIKLPQFLPSQWPMAFSVSIKKYQLKYGNLVPQSDIRDLFQRNQTFATFTSIAGIW